MKTSALIQLPLRVLAGLGYVEILDAKDNLVLRAWNYDSVEAIHAMVEAINTMADVKKWHIASDEADRFPSWATNRALDMAHEKLQDVLSELPVELYSIQEDRDTDPV